MSSVFIISSWSVSNMIATIFCKWNNEKQRIVLFQYDSSSCVLFFLKDVCDFFDHFKNHFLPFYFPSSSFSASLSKKVVVTFLAFAFSCCLVWCARCSLASSTFFKIPSFTRSSRYWALLCGKLGVLAKALFPLLEEASLCLKRRFWKGLTLFVSDTKVW